MIAGVRAADPELIICPFLKDRVPAQVWQNWRTIIIHPGPVGDRGPSSLDWAIAEGARVWGVTALQAVEEMDAGPIWATRTFAMPVAPPRKSSLYNGPVADAAMECIFEAVAKAADPHFTPVPAEHAPTEAPGARPRPQMTPGRPRLRLVAIRPSDIIRQIRAADGAPGVRTELAGLQVFAYDAHPGLYRGGGPGSCSADGRARCWSAPGTAASGSGHLRSPETRPRPSSCRPPRCSARG